MIQVQAQTPARHCPYCRGSLDAAAPGIRCAGCGTVHHELCWLENSSRCTVFRCPGTQTLSRTDSRLFRWLCRILLWLPVLLLLYLFRSYLLGS